MKKLIVCSLLALNSFCVFAQTSTYCKAFNKDYPVVHNSEYSEWLFVRIDGVIIKNEKNKDVAHVRKINKNTVINDVYSGDIVVDTGSTLMIDGIVNGNITIKNGAALYINGILNGNINNIGYCRIEGTIDGIISNPEKIKRDDIKYNKTHKVFYVTVEYGIKFYYRDGDAPI